MRPRPSPIATLVSAILIVGLVSPVGAEPTSPAAGPDQAPEGALSAGQVTLQHIDNGLVNPLGVVNARDHTNRLFVLEQRGTVRIVKNGNVQSGFFLNLLDGVPGGVRSGGERGLLGLAFHPGFDTNRYLFVYYTRSDGDIVVAKLRANTDKTRVPLSSYERVLRIEHSSAGNHNGGQLLFGPDGYLYIFTGDGGGGGDPFENGQNKNSMLGKTLRIAPDLNGGYSTPSSNPYDGSTPGLDEIWAIGLRNPWRASFDRETDGLWIADVGQGSWEEINRVGGERGWPQLRMGLPRRVPRVREHRLLRGDLPEAARGVRPRGRQLRGHRGIRLPRAGLRGPPGAVRAGRLLQRSPLDAFGGRPTPRHR